jgi:hypothetical protein
MPFPDELARGLAVVQHLALIAPDIYQYGQTKPGPTETLMIAAESWASDTSWSILQS